MDGGNHWESAAGGENGRARRRCEGWRVSRLPVVVGFSAVRHDEHETRIRLAVETQCASREGTDALLGMAAAGVCLCMLVVVVSLVGLLGVWLNLGDGRLAITDVPQVPK